MGRQALLAVLCWIALNGTSAKAVQTASSVGLVDNVSSESAPQLYRNPVGVYSYASGSPYAAYSFHVPQYVTPNFNQIVPLNQERILAQSSNQYLKDSYGQRFVAPQAYAYKATLQPQFLPLQKLPAHLSQPLVAAAPNAHYGQATHFFGAPFGLANLQAVSSQNASPFGAPQSLVYAQNVRTLSSPEQNQPYARQQSLSNNNVFANVQSQISQFWKQPKAEIQQEDAKISASDQTENQELVSLPLVHEPKQTTITSFTNGKKTVVNLITKPPVPLLDLTLLQPLTFENPIVPQVQHFLPKIHSVTYKTLPEISQKNHQKVITIKRKTTKKIKKQKKPKVVKDEVEVNTPHHVQHEFTYEVNSPESPNYKETISEKKVSYNKETTSKPVTISYEKKTDMKPVSYSYGKTTQEDPAHYNYVHTSNDPAQLKQAYLDENKEKTKHLIYYLTPEEQSEEQNPPLESVEIFEENPIESESLGLTPQQEQHIQHQEPQPKQEQNEHQQQLQKSQPQQPPHQTENEPEQQQPYEPPQYQPKQYQQHEPQLYEKYVPRQYQKYEPQQQQKHEPEQHEKYEDQHKKYEPKQHQKYEPQQHQKYEEQHQKYEPKQHQKYEPQQHQKYEEQHQKYEPKQHQKYGQQQLKYEQQHQDYEPHQHKKYEQQQQKYEHHQKYEPEEKQNYEPQQHQKYEQRHHQPHHEPHAQKQNNPQQKHAQHELAEEAYNEPNQNFRDEPEPEDREVAIYQNSKENIESEPQEEVYYQNPKNAHGESREEAPEPIAYKTSPQQEEKQYEAIVPEYEEDIAIIPANKPRGSLHATDNSNPGSKHNTNPELQSEQVRYDYNPNSYYSSQPASQEKSNRIIIKDDSPTPKEEAYKQNEELLAAVVKKQEESEDDFEQAYKDAAYGFPAYDSPVRNSDKQKDIYNPANYGVPRYTNDFDGEKSALKQYEPEDDEYPSQMRANYKDIADKTNDEYYTDYAVTRPQALVEGKKKKEEYYDDYNDHKPQKLYAKENSDSDKQQSAKYSVGPAYGYPGATKQKFAKFTTRISPLDEYHYVKEAPIDSTAFGTGLYTSKSKMPFLEPHYQYGFEPIRSSRLLDRELAAMASDHSPETVKKIYKENYYIEKSTTSKGEKLTS